MKSKEVQAKNLTFYNPEKLINHSSDDYDGRKDVWLERTFRFRNIEEFTALTSRERARIVKAQKEREEYEKSW